MNLKLNILVILIVIVGNILMWQYWISTRQEFQALPAYDPDKDVINLPFHSPNRLKI